MLEVVCQNSRQLCVRVSGLLISESNLRFSLVQNFKGILLNVYMYVAVFI